MVVWGSILSSLFCQRALPSVSLHTQVLLRGWLRSSSTGNLDDLPAELCSREPSAAGLQSPNHQQRMFKSRGWRKKQNCPGFTSVCVPRIWRSGGWGHMSSFENNFPQLELFHVGIFKSCSCHELMSEERPKASLKSRRTCLKLHSKMESPADESTQWYSTEVLKPFSVWDPVHLNYWGCQRVFIYVWWKYAVIQHRGSCQTF